MNSVSKLMINEFSMKKLGYDFMGYTFDRTNDLSFHHLIVPRKDSKRILGNDGYIRENGAILVQDSAHEYVHLIQYVDREIFNYITNEMIDENEKGRIDIYNLKRIRELLLYFEHEHERDVNAKGKPLIKYRYTHNRIEL